MALDSQPESTSNARLPLDGLGWLSQGVSPVFAGLTVMGTAGIGLVEAIGRQTAAIVAIISQ
jgi:hypothetical protein